MHLENSWQASMPAQTSAIATCEDWSRSVLLRISLSIAQALSSVLASHMVRAASPVCLVLLMLLRAAGPRTDLARVLTLDIDKRPCQELRSPGCQPR